MLSMCARYSSSIEPDPPTSAALDVIKITSAEEVGGSGSRLV